MKKLLKKVPFSVFLVLIVLIVTSFVLPCMPVQAAADDPECWGVFVGVSDYEYVSGLDYGDDDAQALYDEFSSVWGSSHVRLLTNSEATKSAILSAIDWLAYNAGPNDTVLFAFSGHGIDYEDGYLCPYDSLTTSWDNDISSSELDSAFSGVDANKVVVILDCCYSGIFQDNVGGYGRVLLMASSYDEVSYEESDLEHGVFTYYILEAIDDFSFTDANEDYELSAEEIFDYAGPESTYYESTQHPVLDDGYYGDLAVLAMFVFDTNTLFPYGTSILTLDGVEYTSIPDQFIWTPGGSHTLTVVQKVDAGIGTRYMFTKWNDGTTSVTRIVSNGSFTANYEKQYLLSINSAYGSPTGDGWYKASSTADISVTPLIESANTKHIFTGWSGDFTSDLSSTSIVMNEPKTLTANWRNEYLLTVSSEYNTPTGAGWYKEGESAAIAVEPSQGFLIRHIFNGWSGDFTGTSAAANVNMNSPKVITAVWRTDFVQLYILIGVVVVIIAVVVTTVIVVRQRRKIA